MVTLIWSPGFRPRALRRKPELFQDVTGFDACLGQMASQGLPTRDARRCRKAT